jgi:2-amino-4-hydroxy-6-hydroxymethyldihydropteridine diphosphokinase
LEEIGGAAFFQLSIVNPQSWLLTPPLSYHIPMTVAYIGLGGNLSDPAANIRRALALVGRRLGRVTAVSSRWRTEPKGILEQPWFVNAAAAVETSLSPADFLAGLLSIEIELGRPAHRIKDGPRPIDLDLLLYGALSLSTPNLVVPHPRMHRRRFVLAPLAEIAPEAVHPTLGRTVAGLLAVLEDTAQAEKVGPVEADK